MFAVVAVPVVPARTVVLISSAASVSPHGSAVISPLIVVVSLGVVAILFVVVPIIVFVVQVGAGAVVLVVVVEVVS